MEADDLLPKEDSLSVSYLSAHAELRQLMAVQGD